MEFGLGYPEGLSCGASTPGTGTGGRSASRDTQAPSPHQRIGSRPRGMTKVLLVGKGAPDRGGIPSFIQMLRQSSLADTYEMSFLNVAHGGTPEGGKPTAGNVIRTVRDAFAVRRAARGHDVVHIHSAMAPAVTVIRAALLAAAARSRGAAVVVHVHGGNVEFWLTTRIRRALVKFAMAPAQRVVAVWTAGERALTQVLPATRVQMIDNGVDLSLHSIPRGEHNPFRVLYVGLLTPRKGVLDLLEASSLLAERGFDHELWLLGGTPDEGPSAEAEVRAALDGRARILGTRAPEEMPGVYAEADLFCLPSWWEAMPLSVLEAMASGLPVVATDVGDVSRLVQDGHTGFVVPPRDPEKLASALAELLRDPQRARAMGSAGRARAEQGFSSTATVREVAHLYAELERDRR